MLPMKEHPLGQTYCSGLTWVLKSSLSTRSSCFQSCSLLRSQFEVEAAFSQSLHDLHREKREVPTNTKLFLRLQPHQTWDKEAGRRGVH